MYSVGIDIGSTCAKMIILDEEGRISCRHLRPTGWSSVDTAEELRKVMEEQGAAPGSAPVVATGYGRVSVPFADKTVTEITCHAKGAVYLHGTDNMTVVDICGQDTKVIRIEDGMVKDFVMNDKCSAGTGRFLEVMAGTLGLRPGELCELARSGGGTRISSMCTVFAESEIISLVGRGEKKENLAFAVVDSIADKVVSQVSRLDPGKSMVILTGGLCECGFLREVLSDKLKTDVATSPDDRYAGAVGAALLASKAKMRARG